ncbi:hypothetical protein JWJ90_17795 [Desulfobulbus rhabdoformis]|uniref:hypothetical protein n=1 Tax=Desulfobulbus rhabdoformis TaxID=34032 RepID=UPI0019634C36|nr:hypothetical protein [Desulfobulbus rhabdoformis]MBM9616125.1 hypothetical protein [Desulfobulbus rhabdoformis]
MDIFSLIGKVAYQVGHQATQFLPFSFLALILTELLMRYGFLAKLEPLGAPITRLSRLPQFSTTTLIAAMGSVLAANTMLVSYRQDKRINDKELVLSSLLNSTPAYLKELLTYHFPVIFPLLGPLVGSVYLATFCLAGGIKLFLVVAAGRMLLQGRIENHRGDNRSKSAEAKAEKRGGEKNPATFLQIVKEAVGKQSRVFLRIMAYSLGMMFLVFLGLELGLFQWTESLIGPLANRMGLPSIVLGPLGVYAVSPLAGISSMAALLSHQQITGEQAVVALMIGGLVMAPIIYLRSMVPSYVGLFGLRMGMLIVVLSLFCALSARVLVLILACCL